MTLKSTLSTLIEARRTIALPEHWTKGANARDQEGKALGTAVSRKACRWCATGAIYRANALSNEGSVFDDVEALRVLSSVIAPNGNPNESAVLNTITGFNDAENTSHADVLDLFDQAIECLRERIQRHYKLQSAIAHAHSVCVPA